MDLTYSVYGLTLLSNLPIPGLKAAPASCAIDLTVNFGGPLDCSAADCIPYYVSPYRDERHHPKAIVWRRVSQLHIAFSDGVEFLLDPEGSTIRAAFPAAFTLEYTATYFVGFVLGFVLRLRGCFCLHAAAVVINGQAVALLGEQGAGKSTTAAAFSKLGYSVLSDDITCIADGGDAFMVQPGYPRVNLWSDSVQLLYGFSDALPLIARDWDKRYLALGESGEGFWYATAPLAAIYMLEQRDSFLASPFVAQVPRQQAFLGLVANTYVNFLLDRKMRAQEFDAIGQLVESVPVRRIAATRGPKNLYALCDAIVTDLSSLRPSEPKQHVSPD